ncbi:MAG TPA: acyl-CoA dehydrogenase family protein, partial [Acidimicrobiales bacterium]|nr:acyl-CoA dehydrogenase family protein [Acidimicrobiales bacterium]
MEFTFSPEQEALREAVRSTLAAEAPMAFVRRMLDDERGFTDDLWQKLAGLGWLGLLVPEAQGGLGLGLVDAVVVQEELGRALFPGPYLSSAVLATLAARRLGAAELLAPLASGERRGTVAVEELGHGDPLARIATTAARSEGGWVLEGLKPVVLDGHTADWVIVVAREEG